MKLDAQLTRKIADYVKHGVSYRPAAVANGCDYEEFCSWVEKGREDRSEGKDNLHVKLVRALEKADAEFEAGQTMSLTKAALGFRTQEGEHVEGDTRAVQEALTRHDRRGAESRLERHQRLNY